jgi:pyruvate-formate lyase
MIVRVSGFSAVFVNLSKEVQLELLSRTLNARV